MSSIILLNILAIPILHRRVHNLLHRREHMRPRKREHSLHNHIYNHNRNHMHLLGNPSHNLRNNSSFLNLNIKKKIGPVVIAIHFKIKIYISIYLSFVWSNIGSYYMYYLNSIYLQFYVR